METFLIKAIQLILSLSILVVIHEFGHFLFARLFKIRVEKFYLFFDPWFSLFKFKPKNSDTEYGVGWLPLGGYVKISGMIDESMDKESMAQAPKPWEFRSKPAWQRLLVMAGGVLFNFILAMFIYSMMLFAWGDTYIPTKEQKYGMEFSQIVQKHGFQNGDIIQLVDGEEMNMHLGVIAINDVMRLMDAKEVIVKRNGRLVTISLPDDFGTKIATDVEKKESPFSFITPTTIDSVIVGSIAEKEGLLKGDSIIAINEVEVDNFFAMRNEIAKYADSAAFNIQFYRDTALLSINNISITKDSLLGIAPIQPVVKTDHFTILESFPAGINRGIETLKAYASQMRFLFTKEGVSNIGGFGTIGGLFPPVWDWYSFWTMTAFLSIVLGFMNILPIPALDGGHIMFLLYEVVARRKPSEAFMERAQIAGMLFLLGLMLFANGNDLIRAIFK